MSLLLSNTTKRVISAVAMISALGLVFWLGPSYLIVTLCVVSFLLMDELVVNFAHRKRFGKDYFIGQLILLLGFAAVLPFLSQPLMQGVVTTVGVSINLLLAFYLRGYSQEKEKFYLDEVIKISPACLFPIIFFPLLCLGVVLYEPQWNYKLIALLLAVFTTDSGAWFVGTRWGKNKLYPKVSPNKTIEGAVGGMFLAACVGTSYCFLTNIYTENIFKTFFVFSCLGIISQTGDLVESKMKRQFGIKDSSLLIPGHGGVYDRVDGLIFAAPFYLLMLRFLEG